MTSSLFTPTGNPSLSNAPSQRAYNESKARNEFGNDVIDKLKEKQHRFRGDWWQLAFLFTNLRSKVNKTDLHSRDRLREWNSWREGQLSKDQEEPENNPQYEYIHLEGVDLRLAQLAWVNLSYAHLEQANFSEAHLENAKLRCAHFEDAKLKKSHLEYSNLRHAHLQRADVRGAHFSHSTVYRADFHRTDVRGVTGLLFDGNCVEQILIEGNASDPWSVLRRSYTGPRFFVHLILLILFFLPYAGRLLYLSTASQTQQSLNEIVDRYEPKLETVPGSKSAVESARKWFQKKYRRQRAWPILIGWDLGWMAFLFSIIVVSYNGIRAYLTLKVGMLRDAEERSLISPTLPRYYGWCNPTEEKKETLGRTQRWSFRQWCWWWLWPIRRWWSKYRGFRCLILPYWMRRWKWF